MATKLRASFWRGGTSNGLLIHKKHLPRDPIAWHAVLCPAMGSPDSYGRQLNGMGGGISSLSKICVVAPSSRAGIDVDYTFIQVGIKDRSLDMAGNCGNMSSAVGPFALDENMIPSSRIVNVLQQETGRWFATVRMWNTNTSKVTESKFAIKSINGSIYHDASGDYAIDGVSGTASPIALSFLSPGGSRTGKVFPTGNKVDEILLPDGTSVSASLVDVSNPGVFVRASDLGISLPISDALVEGDAELMKKIAKIRRVGATRMGLDPNMESVPKILLLSTPRDDEDVNIRCLAFSMGQCHKAVPLTLSLNLGVACRINGTLPWQLSKRQSGTAEQISETVTIAHASGKIDVQADIENGEVKSAILMRTARLLMEGEVNCA
ncbi:DUF453-domain-containing protein [Polyplosphaeria fusca]|uniref:DUF453-domain-containing protein n=1 Tax=Polyplosphaeria fusca TaxID=682080 RepID=A0A9P4QZB5_9PLEO|nr:DUF453-domain-containing protein [Polyplosphaeria fusca]